MVSEPYLDYVLMVGEGKEDAMKSKNKEINANAPRSPFYLSSSDNLGNIIQSVILYDENYAN